MSDVEARQAEVAGSVTCQRHLDVVCVAFENAWQVGGSPALADYLADCPAADRPALLRELLLLEWEYASQRGVLPLNPAEYAARFAGDQDVAWAAWEVHQTRFGSSTREVRGGRFAIEGPLARGGLGQVYLARDADFGRRVALKELRGVRASDPASQERLLQEAGITGRLEHPGIVPVYALGRNADGSPFYAMRLVEGATLHEAIGRFHASAAKAAPPDGLVDHTTDSRLSPLSPAAYDSPEFRRLLQRLAFICLVVEFAHRREIVHRDIKPANILLGSFGEAYLSDWGLAFAAETTPAGAAAVGGERAVDTVRGAADSTGEFTLGTPAYMSPEQARGEPAGQQPATDIYGLGATLYHLLIGAAPFAGLELDEILRQKRAAAVPPLTALQPHLPAGLTAICHRALAPSPAERYESARALAEDLECWLAQPTEPPCPERLA